MKIVQKSGKLWINDKEVKMVIFEDNTTSVSPFPDTDNNNGDNSATNVGKGTIVQNSKNVVTGNVSCMGSFRLGDG